MSNVIDRQFRARHEMSTVKVTMGRMEFGLTADAAVELAKQLLDAAGQIKEEEDEEDDA